MEITESKRLQVVDQFEKLNLGQNKELNDLVSLASEVCEVPIALITLMHETKQLIQCKKGIDIKEISRKHTFCRYLVPNDVLIVRDTLNDERFIDNPFVTGELGIRFYAGAPLVTNTGFNIGSFCVADSRPHNFTNSQKEVLEILARQVMYTMELQISLNLIIAQHESLLNVANIQSHEYRKPVATILGLMGLIKAEGYLPDKECLMMMETAVEELDQKIKKVITFIQDTPEGN